VKNSTILRVVILGALAIVSIIGIQMYWVFKTWDAKEQEFHEKVNIALLNVGRSFEKLGKPLPEYNLIERVSSNYYVVNINDIINANNLEFFLRKELEAVGLTDDFEYGIYDCATDKMVNGNYISYTPLSGEPQVQHAEALPTYNKYLYYFGVRFPNRNAQILGSMPLTVIFSVLLLLTLTFFTYSIFVILRQKRLSEMQKDFINNMTHEFKTPISTIKISADVFMNNTQIQQDKRLSQYARIIREQNQRLNDQVEKVLQLARVERENFKLAKEPIVLHEVLDEVLAGVGLKVQKLNGTLQTDLQAERPQVLADPLHLTNILHNLLDNAMKYCRQQPHITVRTVDEGKFVRLTVEDQGIGIPKEYQERVFQKFFRVPTGNVHNVKGFGLGLFYIKNICRSHGWRLQLHSEPGVGTAVSICMKTISV